MNFKPRYRFWQVLVGIIAAGILFAIIYYASGGKFEDETPDTTSDPESSSGSSVISGLFSFAYFVLFLYFALNYYYYLISGYKSFFSFLKTTVAIIFVAFLYHSLLFYYLPVALSGEYESLGDLFSGMMSGVVPMLIISFLFAYITHVRESLKQRRVLEAQKLQLEKEISEANFNFLKSQINPHFLHNTLNFLYSKSLPYSSELSEGILTLSDIMRYALDQGNQKKGKAPLKDEIEHVRNVIRISQLRYSNELKVNFEVSGSVNGHTIIPFVLITLVENAFKHGDLKNPEYPIDIKLDVKGSRLYFYCRNKKKTAAMHQPSTGIGLENIKKRLYLAYGEGYKFIVKDEPEFYTTELTIEKL